MRTMNCIRKERGGAKDVRVCTVCYNYDRRVENYKEIRNWRN